MFSSKFPENSVENFGEKKDMKNLMIDKKLLLKWNILKNWDNTFYRILTNVESNIEEILGNSDENMSNVPNRNMSKCQMFTFYGGILKKKTILFHFWQKQCSY